jgi:two-component system chemotaxis response regulator CheB
MDEVAIVIGASAGGLTTLQEILAPLPANFRYPILVVQHRRPAQDDLMAFTLNESSRLHVKEADQLEPIRSGTVYLAPANYHLLVEADKTLSLSIDDKVSYSRPSIDVLFESAAAIYRSDLVGIILTGANHDGTIGLQKIKEYGGLTIAQDPASAEVPTMPNSAIQNNVVDKILSPTEITNCLTQLSIEGYINVK